MIQSVPDAPHTAQAPQVAYIAAPSAHCPNCGCPLGSINLYVGGRGYVAYDVCQNPDPLTCDYRKRQVAQ